jgi:hypothetical protein
MDGPALAIADSARDVRSISPVAPPSPTLPGRVSASLFVPTIDARILAANVRAQTPVMVKRLGMIVVGDDDARALGAYCAALRTLLKANARVHGLTAPGGTPLRSLRDFVRAYFDVPVTDDFKAPGSAGKRIVNTINHYSNTYGATSSESRGARPLRSPVKALRSYIARMFPKLASVEEARSIVVDVTARYEALVRSAASRQPAARPGVRSAA